MKKCWFHKKDVWFLKYVISSQGIWIEDKKIETVRNWLEPKVVKDIQFLIGFTNFYWCFLQGFRGIVALLTSMLKTNKSFRLSALKIFKDKYNKVVWGGNRDDKTIVDLSKSKKSKNKKSEILIHSIITGKPMFLTPDTKEVLNRLRQSFIKASILWHFNPECDIRIKTNASSYVIGGVLS